MRILVSAGEASGDAIGAELADGFRQHRTGCEIAGAAGPRMAGKGLRVLARAEDFSHAGWASVAARLPWLAWKAWLYFRRVERFRPDLAVVVDAPGLHAPLLRRLRRRGVTSVWVAPPQLWAWKNRSAELLRGMRVYPAHAFEADSLQKVGARPAWWGYPGPRPVVVPCLRPSLLALFPGSRPAWRALHTELFGEAARRAGLPLETVLVHPHPPPAGREAGLPCLSPGEALSRAGLALSLPGTATLETALWGVPTVVAARPHGLDVWLARTRLSEGPRALPNRILEDPVFPEFYGLEANPDCLAASLSGMFDRWPEVVAALRGLAERMGACDAAASIAADALRELSGAKGPLAAGGRE